MNFSAPANLQKDDDSSTSCEDDTANSQHQSANSLQSGLQGPSTMYVVPPGRLAKEFYLAIPKCVLFSAGTNNMVLFGFLLPCQDHEQGSAAANEDGT